MQAKVSRKFRKLTIDERITALFNAGYLSVEDRDALRLENQRLSTSRAERMVENVVGVFGLPEGIAINFPVNGKHYAVPMVVEEPSVVAALSYAGLLAENAGGFQARTTEPVLIGQLQMIDVPDIEQAETSLREEADHIMAHADGFLTNMVARGGGAKALSTRRIKGLNSRKEMLIVNISFDTRDAMGANLVNSVCEGIAPLLETITGGTALLKILSNLADQSMAIAEVKFPPSQLGAQGYSGEQVRDRIVLANDFALEDPYRAATHNKGIMNGIDALALATGNDWRSLEASVHAYASRTGQYRSLTQWVVGEEGNLEGRIELPLKVGIVGASLQTNPAVELNLRLLGVGSATELAGVMSAVGLAQNFAALRALVTSGIQQGHMTLHARSVALTASAPEAIYDEVVRRLIAEGNIKVQRAKEIIDELRK